MRKCKSIILQSAELWKKRNIIKGDTFGLLIIIFGYDLGFDICKNSLIKKN